MNPDLPDWMPEPFSDAVRDARALIRTVLADDTEGSRAILAALADDRDQAGAVTMMLAEIAAELLRHAGDHWLIRLVHPE